MLSQPTLTSTSSVKGKSKFTPEEDIKLSNIVAMRKAPFEWVNISRELGTKTPRQCRERYQNYLDPRLINKEWTPAEDAFLLYKLNEIGPHWNAIARSFYGRSGNTIRNRYMVLIRREERKVRDRITQELLIKKAAEFKAKMVAKNPVSKIEKIPLIQPIINSPIKNEPVENDILGAIFETYEDFELENIDCVF